MHLEFCATTTSISKTFLLPQKEILYPLNSYSLFYLLPPGNHQCAFCLMIYIQQVTFIDCIKFLYVAK